MDHLPKAVTVWGLLALAEPLYAAYAVEPMILLVRLSIREIQVEKTMGDSWPTTLV